MVQFKFLFIIFVSSISFGQVKGPNGLPAYTGKQEITNSSTLPEELIGVNITEKLGDTLDLDQIVTNEKGESVPLKTFFHTKKPVMISPMYFECPGLCSFHFNGVVDTLKKIDWNPGEKFEVIAFSFDDKEKSELAAQKKESYMKVYGRNGAENGFHFLTASKPVIDVITKQLGFQFKWNSVANEWAHASAAIIVTPDGKISRYLHGIDFDVKDMKLALNEASNGHIGNIIDSVVLFCFKYDEHKSKYGLQVFRVVQLGGALTVLILALWLTPVFLRTGREKV